MGSRTIFIAYSHRDRSWEEKVESHIRVIQHALSDIEVWDDRQIGAGEDWLQAIEQAITRARVAVLLVSESFLTSDFITRKEIPQILRVRASGGLTVIPVLVKACAWKTVPWLKTLSLLPSNRKPLDGLRHKANEVLADLATTVLGLLGPDRRIHTLPTLPAGLTDVSALHHFPVSSQLPLPCFFPSVSGAAKSLLSPLDHLRQLVALRVPCFLASVYDLASARSTARAEMRRLIAKAVRTGQIVLLDSGLYERKWLHDPTWSRAKFRSALARIPCNLAFAYDAVKRRGERTVAADIVAQVLADRRKTDLTALFPIIHADAPNELPKLVKEVAIGLDSDIIAVAERELGDGVLACAETIIKTRRALDDSGRYRVIHILGTGNPLSLLIYSACGADSFDGLDWCQTVADHDSKRLFHSQQLDFFLGQSEYSGKSELPYSTRMLAHNLEFFSGWMREIQRHRVDGTMRDLLHQNLPEAFSQKLAVLLDQLGSKP